MSVTQVPIELSSTPGIVDNSNATAITIDSSENVTFSGAVTADGLTVDTSDQVIINHSADGGGIRIDSTNATNTGSLRFGDVADNYIGAVEYNHTNDSMSFYANNAERMRIDSSGNVGIKTSSPNATLELGGAGEAIRLSGSSTTAYIRSTDGTTNQWFIGSGGNAGLQHYIYQAQPMTFHTSGTERMRIDSSGQVLIGGTTLAQNNSAGFTASGVLTIARSSGVNRNMILFNNAGSQVGSITTTTSATTYNTSSDQRLKENITDADDAGSKVDAIQVRKFNWIADGSHQDYGMVAQELLTVAPEAVSAPEDPDEMMGVDYSKLVPMLVKEIQSLRARVAQLENN